MSTDLMPAADEADEAALFASALGKGKAAPEEPETPEPELEEPVSEEPVAEAPVEEQAAENPAEAEARRVPLSELMKERKARQQSEERERQAQIRAALLEQQYRLAQQPQQREPEPVPDYIDDAPGFVRHEVRPIIDPLVERINQMNLKMAVLEYGKDKVSAAQEAFDSALNRGELHPHEARQVMDASNPWEAAIQWKARRDVLSEVGTDPAAYEQKLFQKLMSDPAKRAQLMQGLNAGAAVPPQQPKTQIKLPTSISNVGSALPAKAGVSDSDEDALWREATARRR